MSKPWTVEVQNADGSWEPLYQGGRAWCYATEANALKDIGSKCMRRYIGDAPARPALIVQK